MEILGTKRSKVILLVVAGLLSVISLSETQALEIDNEARIHVDAGQVSHHLTRYMTGNCIEDVNHEIYGGIYSQMIFGESFEEPLYRALKGFRAYRDGWKLKDQVLQAVPSVSANKLIVDYPEFSNGEFGVEVYLEENRSAATLLVKVKDGVGVGGYDFVGYQISLYPTDEQVTLSHRRQSPLIIESVKCEAPVKQWIPIVVKMEETSLEVFVNGESVLKYKDEQYPLRLGRVGLHNHERKVLYRNLWVKTGEKKQTIRFEYEKNAPEISGMWRAVHRGSARGRFALESEGTFNGKQSQRITFLSGEGEIGIENQDLNRQGMYFESGKPYDGYIWVKAEKPTDIYVALESGDGSDNYAETALRAKSADWHRLDFKLTPTGTDRKGRFAIKLKKPGSILVGHAFLQPGPWGRFKDLPVRKDVVDKLIAQGVTVLRYGGCMADGCEPISEYRWKKMVGPRDRRLPYRGFWYPYSSNGWGIIDFIDLCEAAGFLCVPDFNIAETPEDMADFVEYVNGGIDTEWGKKRADAGHPKPYNLKYIQLGNELAIDDEYFQRFKPLVEAIWSKDPNIIPVVGDFFYPHFTDPFNFNGRKGLTSLEAHIKILDLAKAHGKPVWFDLHIGNDNPRDPDLEDRGLVGLRDYIKALSELRPKADFKVCVFEENAHNNAVRRALGHAHAVNELERVGPTMQIVCSANGLQVQKQNDNEWDQGYVFMTPSQVWGSPPSYVTQMISRNYLPLCIKAKVESPDNALDVTAKKSEDGKTLTMQVVNVEDRQIRTSILLEGFTPSKPTVRVIQLRGDLNDVNTPEEPEKITPWQRDWSYELDDDGAITYTFPPYSFTILRFE